MKFEWDADKAASNLKKHGVDFSVAVRVFGDENRIEDLDPRDYDEDEVRWITIGFAFSEELVVVYVEREDRVRIISARKAETHERRQYWEHRRFQLGRGSSSSSD